MNSFLIIIFQEINIFITNSLHFPPQATKDLFFDLPLKANRKID